ncbi:MAG: bifunctional adenosylcobinamide kinase/adenosylcobinamide-phosphate guanylyltransferase [Clostridiales bacterium]|nr:bifunctional adenosylcobinamide kinase/adenosylcobinamide-phosphate guanylyltransferase [Clostridiales bacterium]
MILIFGGAYQGKLAYAKDRFGLSGEDVYMCSEDDARMPAGKTAVNEIDKWILALVKAGIGVDERMQLFIQSSRSAIVISNDISCGVVPADSLLREWREAVGRSLAELSRASDETVRLFCGIPTRIK